MQSCSKIFDKKGLAMLSVLDKCSVPSKVANLSFKAQFLFEIKLTLVFLDNKQNCGDQETFIN